MRDAAGSSIRVGDLVRPCAHVGDEVGQRPHRQARVYRQHLRIGADNADRGEVLGGIGPCLAERRRDRDLRRRRHEQRRAVGGGRAGGGRGTASVASAPAAPGRFSTTKGSPNASPRCWAMMRAMASVLPPAPNGTSSLTGFCGQLCACTGATSATKVVNSATKIVNKARAAACMANSKGEIMPVVPPDVMHAPIASQRAICRLRALFYLSELSDIFHGLRNRTVAMARKIDWERQIGRRFKLRDLHVFATVVQRGSMAKAAEQLGVSQPAISEVIADLERALGVRLLDRNPQGVEPNIFGRALFKRCRAVFDELKQGIN